MGSPIFVLGLPYSGDALLVDRLVESGEFDTVTARDVAHFYRPKHPLNLQMVTGTPLGDERRPTADNSAEYGLILRSVEQPHWRNYAGTVLQKALRRRLLNERNRHLLDHFIERSEKPILLRNSADFSNFTTIKNRYPTARFIFILRDKRAIVAAIKAWLSEYAQHGNSYYDALGVDLRDWLAQLPRQKSAMRWRILQRAFLVEQMVSAALRHYHEHINQLNSEVILTIDHADLSANPTAITDQVLRIVKSEATQHAISINPNQSP